MATPDFRLTPHQDLTIRCLFSGTTTTGQMVKRSGEDLFVKAQQPFEPAAPIQVTVRTGCFFLGHIDSVTRSEEHYQLRIKVNHWISGDDG
jgi:hypothetical protein